jgi:hypothetical protein
VRMRVGIRFSREVKCCEKEVVTRADQSVDFGASGGAEGGDLEVDRMLSRTSPGVWLPSALLLVLFSSSSLVEDELQKAGHRMTSRWPRSPSILSCLLFVELLSMQLVVPFCEGGSRAN